MSGKFKWLQFFADGASGGDGGDGAATGVTSADAGQNSGGQADDAGQQLEKLGVPKDKVAKYGKMMAKRQQAERQAQPSAVEESPQERDFDKEWNDFMADPKHQEHLQTMMAERGKSATEAKNAAQEFRGKVDPIISLLSDMYGIQRKDGEIDIDELVKAVTDDDRLFEDKALEKGESVEKVKTDWQKEREEKLQAEKEREQILQERFMAMQQQSADVREEYPNFDLDAELQSPEFVHMTLPAPYGLGWDVRRAFRALHQDDIEKQQVAAIAERAKADAAKVRQANQMRPRENGSGSSAASARMDPRALMASMKPDERLAFVKSHRF